ncbi:MAG TPA: thermostable hemolysin [Phenylobacterium sp.]|nr:thermostable hemolysin [Phenylobacterium sp.]
MMMEDDGAPAGSLTFDAERLRRFTRLEPKVISIHHLLRPERLRVEAFLEAAYARAIDGRIRSHYPTLMSLQDRSGQIHAAVGFRTAAAGPLFLEQYLDAPVETALSAGFGDVARSEVAEIGNLASESPGASLFLFLALARHLHGLGCAYAVATATRQLRRGFARVGFETITLSAARPERLGERADDWGGYYDRDPEVMAGPIAPALPALGRMLVSEPAPAAEVLPRLHPDLSDGDSQ